MYGKSKYPVTSVKLNNYFFQARQYRNALSAKMALELLKLIEETCNILLLTQNCHTNMYLNSG